VLQKILNLNRPYDGPAHEGALVLEKEGHFLLRGEFAADEVARLRDEILEVYARVPPEMRAGSITREMGEMYRYEMFNRSALCQEAIARPAILAILDPLLGADCHVIACTAWKNPPGNEHAPNGQQWHVDGGPHVPHAEGVAWPANIPYPIFVVATHIFLQDCRLEDGPTACIPGSHTSGLLPPHERMWDIDLTYGGRGGESHIANAGDVAFRVSDVWHRRLPPAPNAAGRFFLQTNYARRDIAQRVLAPDEVTHTTAESRARARTDRERHLIGLHGPGFYDG
jgi:ectoine hydroxylase-related dioxygenase (phytanoyl-CoA dioxygenase family)